MPPPTYFPPLAKCLTGSERLISWKTAYQALCDLGAAKDDTALEQFFASEETIRTLATTLSPAKPNASSKSAFDEKTLPINVTQSVNGKYNLEEMKKDALWLSKETDIEELEALRVTIVEWQDRAAAQLSLATASTKNAVSIDFDNEEVRKDRLLCVYLEEKRSVLRVSVEIVGYHALEHATGSWIDEVAHKLMTGVDILAKISNCVNEIEKCVKTFNNSDSWPAIFKQKEELWCISTLFLITDRLRLLLSLLHTLPEKEIPDANIVSKWFQVMDSSNFLQDLQGPPAFENMIDTIQCLGSMASLAMLQAPKVIVRCREMVPRGTVQYSDLLRAYIKDDECIKSVNFVMYKAAQTNCVVASPAIYAWALIALTIRDIASAESLKREDQLRRQDDGSSDTETSTSPSIRRRRSIIPETEAEKKWDAFHDPELEDAREDPVEFYARSAVDVLNVFEIIPRLSLTLTSAYSGELTFPTALISRHTLLDLIREGLPIIYYEDTLIEAVLAVVNTGTSKNATDSSHFSSLPVRLLKEELLRNAIVRQAFARYPYELSPLLRICIALCSAESAGLTGSAGLLQILDNLDTITLMVQEHFRSYELENEDENINAMKLTSALPVFVPKQDIFLGQPIRVADLAMGNHERNEITSVLSVPAGTPGFVVKEDRPMVFQLQHPHSGLEYLGLLLSTFLPSSELAPSGQQNILDHQTASETIMLITLLMTSALKQPQGPAEAELVLSRVSNAIPVSSDIIGVIAEIFEIELLAHTDQVAKPGSLDLVVACAEFFDALATVFPERIWATLSRSSLVGLNQGGACALAAVVSGTEVHIQQYRFLAACTRIYSQLVDDAAAGVVKRKGRESKRGHRFDSPTQTTASEPPERTMSAVLETYTRIMLDVNQSLSQWRFRMVEEKQAISIAVATSFEQLLRWTYGLEPPGKAAYPNVLQDNRKEQISALLVPAAEMVLDAFAPIESEDDMLVAAITNQLADGLALSEEALPPRLRSSCVQQIRQTCHLLCSVLRSVRVSELPQRAFSLALQLVQRMPTLVKLYALEHGWKMQLAKLLKEVLKSLVCTDADPPSLLSSLNLEAAKAFLSVVSELDQPLCNWRVEVEVWSLLATVLGCKQQWFAMYLLTGTLPRQRLKETSKNGAVSHSKSLLHYALDQLSAINDLNPRVAVYMLQFVAVAQEVWMFSTRDVRAHGNFFQNTLEWLDGLDVPNRRASASDSILSAREQRMAAYLCDIISINLQASLESGDKSLQKLLTPKLAYLTTHAVKVDTYNRSLHHQLAKNISERFPGCELKDFKRSPANPAPYGDNFFYDLDVATKVFAHESLAWYGSSDLRTKGFKDEFARANANLSLLDGQMELLKAWKKLATILAEYIDQDESLQKALVQTVEACLNANATAEMDVPGTADMLQMRAEMAFVLISRLVSVKANDNKMRELLPAAWQLVRSSPVNYDVATAQEDLAYYRLLLQVLCLAVQPHAYMPLALPGPQKAAVDGEDPVPTISISTANILVEIVQKTIAPSFQALCANLHSDVSLALPADFALLTGLLRSIFAVKGVTLAYHSIAEAVVNSGVIRGSLSLYSWSDQLAEVLDQDPVYGEIAIVFLLTLSAVPAIAEQMALDGVLAQLANANLSNYFRKPAGKGPFDAPSRMFTIWTEGFLPLCLNLLDAVGPPLAGEVAMFLNSFPEQLRRAENAFQPAAPSRRHLRHHDGDVTLGLLHEAHSLVLLTLAVRVSLARAAAEGVDAVGIPQVEYNLANARAEVEKLTRTRRSLADKIVPLGEVEWRWAREKVEGAGDNRLQAMVMREVKEILDLLGGVEG